MRFLVMKVKQYNAPFKHILIIDDVPVILTSSENRAISFIKYIKGEDVAINDGEVKKILDTYRNKRKEVSVSA